MAWRIHDSVIRGEVDNRRKGIVQGKLWLDGIAEPVVLELTGNACGDLAGCLLKFTNSEPTVPMRRDVKFAVVQRGRVGNLTASRKVRVTDILAAEAYLMAKRGEKPAERMANALYLEWFSEANGRVVIESTDFHLEVSPPEWSFTPEDEAQRMADATVGWREFIDQLDEAVSRHQLGAKDPEEDWDEHDCERFLRECDARTDKYGELLDKYGHTDEAHDRVAREMGWTRDLSEEEAEEEQRHIDEINTACESALNEPPPEPDPLREGIDWVRTDSGDVRHPLQHRCFEAGTKLWRGCKELGVLKDADIAEFVFEFQTTGVKLSGALNSLAMGDCPPEPAFTIAYLKRALDHLHKAQAALERAVSKQGGSHERGAGLPDAMVVEARRELFEIREGILNLMRELREDS